MNEVEKFDDRYSFGEAARLHQRDFTTELMSFEIAISDYARLFSNN